MARRRRPNDRPDDFSNFDARPLIAAFQRLDRRAQLVVVCVLAVVGGVALTAYLVSQRHRLPDPTQTQTNEPPAGPSSPSNPPAPSSASMDPAENLLLGNPSGATADPANKDNYLMVKPFFALSYNDANGTPNWVSWRVTAGDLGGADRAKEFSPDVALPRGFKVVTTQDYTGSGFDRGHLCPHADRAIDAPMSRATFVMTNMIPQSPNVNQKAWAELENYARGLVHKQRLRLYTVAGPAGRGGRGKFGAAETVGKADAPGGKGRVVVPAECWKIIVAVPETGGPADPATVSPAARVITVVMPNDEERVTTDAWAPYRTSPAEVERRTGFRFFDRLPPATADALRRKVDDAYVPPPKPHRDGKPPREE